MLRAAVVAAVAALVLSGCSATPGGGGGDGSEAALLRVVMLGSENETLDYGSAQSYFPWTVIGNACDSLVVTRDGAIVDSLAETIVPNADATEWIVTIRDGVTFHNGTALTAEDVVASIRYFAASPGFGTYYSVVDLDGLTAVDARTVRVPLTAPRADFVDTVLGSASVVFEAGEGTAEMPSCSGPFRLESFDQDTGAVLLRHEGYWGERALLERLEIRRVADPAARVNALVSGEADYAFDIPSTGAATVGGVEGLQVMTGGVANSGAMYFVLNTRVAPFDDPAVRRALTQVVNREQLVSVVLGEYGQLGNDLFGKGLEGYDGSIAQRTQDLDAARATLAAAGVTALDATVAELTPGLRDATELLGQQLAEVGVQLTIDEIDPSSFFTDLDRLYSSQIISMYGLNRPVVVTLPQLFGAENPYAFSGWNPPQFTTLVEQMQQTVDDSARQAVLDQIQQLQWEQGGYLVWGYREQISAARAGLAGVRANVGYPVFAQAGFR
ncbi:ABC transporter substrate-binding protein [Pseudonocardia sichuanensis]|uniref:Peptide/nickel transport system substrate-binding protein n=1 Tax=Pseudonocardia kunmingensis TaxID=630975 RepID=A0A543D9V3_9PSEU|nr:ABC transporter substrate-binding protein [Pseudonocardia kunmingensis]TQM06058.1 peptide/nickel transport system substrate-binding protein [Pseudonocardia kunmingensis]